MDYCAACLSSDRSLILIKDVKSAPQVLDLLSMNLSPEDVVCWECEAWFYRINGFRNRIQQAQDILKLFCLKKCKKKLKSLSQLGSSKKDSYDKVYAFQEATESVHEINCDSDNDFEVDFIEDWEGFDEAPEENETLEANETQEANEIIAKEESDEVSVKIEEILDDHEVTYQDPQEPIRYKMDPIMKLNKDEESFIVIRMSLEQMYKCRDLDRKAPVYQRCPYKCIKCVIGYYQEERYNRHLKEKHDKELNGRNRVFKCSICDIYFTRPNTLEAHYDRHFRKYKCKECDFEHHKIATMLAHKANNHQDGDHTCDICHKKFDRPRHLWYHKEQHKERPKCDVCGKTVSIKHNLKVHMLTHTGVKRVACPDCGRRVRWSSLTSHRKTHLPRSSDERAFCVECGLQFGSPQLYRRHLVNSRKHVPENQHRFKCTQCDSKFLDKYALTRHVATMHLKIYPFKCHVCGKGFIRKDRMADHVMERHEGISRPKDKVCVYCGRGFKAINSLKRHIRVHTGERPYSCPYCPATFSQSSTRNTHVRGVHKEETNK